MREYRSQPSNTTHHSLATAVAAWWLPSAFLFAFVAILAMRSAGVPFSPALGYLGALALLGAFASAGTLAGRAALRHAGRQMAYTLNTDSITRHRDGSPDICIPFSKIACVYEGSYWLEIESVEPHVRIIVPRELAGFDKLVMELAQHKPVDSRKPRRAPIFSLAVLLLSVASWVVFLWSESTDAELIVVAIAVAALGVASLRWRDLIVRPADRWHTRAGLAAAWIAAAAAIALRMLRR